MCSDVEEENGDRLNRALRLARDTKFITFLLLDERVGVYGEEVVNDFFQVTLDDYEYQAMNEAACACYYARCLELASDSQQVKAIPPQFGVHCPEYPMHPNEEYLERYIKMMNEDVLSTYVYFPPGPARQKLFSKLLTRDILTPSLLVHFADKNMFETAMVEEFEAAFDMFESKGNTEKLRESLTRGVDYQRPPHRFLHPDRICRYFPVEKDRLNHLIALFKDPMFCRPEEAFELCVKYLSEPKEHFEKAMQMILNYNPVIMAESDKEDLVCSVWKEYPSLVETTLRGFATFRPGTAKRGFHESPKTISLLKHLLDRIDNPLTRAKYESLLTCQAGCPEAPKVTVLESLYDSGHEAIMPGYDSKHEGLPRDILFKIGLIPKSVSKAANCSPYSTSHINPIAFFDTIAEPTDFQNLEHVLDPPPLLLDDADLQLFRQLRDHTVDYGNYAKHKYIEELTMRDLRPRARFTIISRYCKA